MNLRVNAEGKPVTHGRQVEIGGNDRYVPMCRRHFVDATKQPDQAVRLHAEPESGD